MKGEAADVLCRTDDDSDDENAVMSWADALAAVPRELPARLYGSPPKERRAPSRHLASAPAPANIYLPSTSARQPPTRQVERQRRRKALVARLASPTSKTSL